jgi:hypothetical protein
MNVVRTYQSSDNSAVLDALNEFPTIGAADFEVTFVTSSNAPDPKGHSRSFQVFPGGKGAFKYDYPVEITPSEVTDLSGTVDGSQVGTAQRMLGQGSSGSNQEIGYAAFPSYLSPGVGHPGAAPGPRVVTDAAYSNGSVTLTSASAGFTAADVGQAVYALDGSIAIGTFIAAYVSATQVTLNFRPFTTVTGTTVGIGGHIIDVVGSALQNLPVGSLFSQAAGNLTRGMKAQNIPSFKMRADGPKGLMGNVFVGDVVPVYANFGWVQIPYQLMRVVGMTLYPVTEELTVTLNVVNPKTGAISA